MDARSLQRESWAFGRARAEIRQFVRRNRTRPIAVKQVWQHVTRKLGRQAATPKEVLTILDRLPNLEREAKKDSFVVSLRELSYTDRCEVTLRARGPMHLRDLNSAIVADSSERNRRKIKLTSALLSGSRRFVPIGRTGYWALREWQDVETHAIPGMTAELLNLPRHLYTTSQ
jgi:hypothetical protein